MNRGYIIKKDPISKELTYIEYEGLKETGYNITPKKNIKIKNAIRVSKVIFTSPSLIEKILHKKLDKEYNKILNLVGEILVGEDDDTGRMIGVLNQVELFKSIIKNKYAKFMTTEQTDKLLKRLHLMSKEIRKRAFEIEQEKYYQDENNLGGKSR